MSRRIIVKLVHDDRAVNLAVKSDDGVDLVAIGRAFGLEPATIRLNGHFLGSSGGGGPYRHVSSVTWHCLLSFFASRGFPAGDSLPIAVLGKPSAVTTAEGADCPSFKRKIALDDERPTKRNRRSINDQQVGNATISDDETISIGKRLKLDDDQPSKRPKMSNYSSGSTGEASELPRVSSRFGFTYDCLRGLGKRLREEEMAVPVSCKRVK